MLNPKLLTILCGLPDGEAALAVALDAVAHAARPYGLRFAFPARFAPAVAAAQLPAGALNAGDIRYYGETGGLAEVPPLLTDETHFLLLEGAYAFGERWDRTIFSRYAKIPVRRALLTAALRGEGGAAQPCLPAFRGEIHAEGAPLGPGLMLVRSAAPVKTMLAHPAFVFGTVAFLRNATPNPALLSIAAYTADYAVYALDRAPLWPSDGRQAAARLCVPPPDSLPSTALRRFEQLAGLSFQAHTASVRATYGVFGVEDAYPQRMPFPLSLEKRVRALARPRAAAPPLTVTAFVDLPDARRPIAAYLLRFSFLKALEKLPLTLYTGGEAERQLRAGFPNTLAYPDNTLLPRELLAAGITPMQLFKRNKLLLLERASYAFPGYEHLAWLDIDALPHPVCPQAAPDCAALTDGRVHLGWVDGRPDTSMMVVPKSLLKRLAGEVRAITQLDADMKRSFSERQLYRRLLDRFPDWFAFHPLPRKGLLFLSCFPESLLGAPYRPLIAALPEPVRTPEAAPETKEEAPDD